MDGKKKHADASTKVKNDAQTPEQSYSPSNAQYQASSFVPPLPPQQQPQQQMHLPYQSIMQNTGANPGQFASYSLPTIAQMQAQYQPPTWSRSANQPQSQSQSQSQSQPQSRSQSQSLDRDLDRLGDDIDNDVTHFLKKWGIYLLKAMVLMTVIFAALTFVPDNVMSTQHKLLTGLVSVIIYIAIDLLFSLLSGYKGSVCQATCGC
jgi:hypothetical protein